MASDSDESSLEALKQLALRATDGLSEEDAAKLAAGVRRNRQYAEALRALVTPDLEPAFRFEAGEGGTARRPA